MTRWLVALLLAANVLFFAWTQGWLDKVLGPATPPEREPQRLSLQVQPQSVAVLSPKAASAALAAAMAAAKAAATCLEAGPFGQDDVAKAETELGTVALPDGSWQRVIRSQAGAWIIYMGKFTNADMQKRKGDELKRMKMPFEELHDAPTLQPGFSLGQFSDAEGAKKALDTLSERGLRTAKVVALREASEQLWLRAPQADPDLATRLTALKSPALGAGFKPCAK